MSRCWFVDDNRHLLKVKRLYELVGVSRARYYRWKRPRISNRELAETWLTNAIYDTHVASRSTYGSPRLFGQLRRNGWRIGENRVARLMADAGLVGAHSRKRWRRGRPNTAHAPDLLERDFTAERSDQRWVADISEFKCLAGKLFLAGIVDLHDRSMVGWSMGERQTTDLVVNALVMALARRQPDGELVHHADRGNPPNTPRSSSRTDCRIGISERPTGRPKTVSTTPRWSRRGRRSSVTCCRFTAIGNTSRGPSCGRFCSTTSKRSTTGNDTRPDCNITLRPRSTLPQPSHKISQQPLPHKAGGLHSPAASSVSTISRMVSASDRPRPTASGTSTGSGVAALTTASSFWASDRATNRRPCRHRCLAFRTAAAYEERTQ